MKKLIVIFRFIRNYKWYFVSVFFFVWIFFLDRNNILLHIERERAISDLQDSIKYYKKAIEQQKDMEQVLDKNSKTLELFIRSQYNFKKPSEDIFIIEKH